MGARKRISAEKRKEARKSDYYAKLNNVPTSPRKMRLVADMIRGMEVNRALGVLRFSTKDASIRLEKLLRSAISNYEQKTEQNAVISSWKDAVSSGRFKDQLSKHIELPQFGCFKDTRQRAVIDEAYT